ncbi:MAG TPA: sigma-70 family RNA polymerase sigma factor [Saprospiraceae bacterium]|nr:sigma-70 family RNA polymerase sigma factor [Saprospiraceae bacterium]
MQDKKRELVQACIRGEAKAISLLYHEFGAVLFGICMRYTDHKQDAEDVMQESFIKILSELKTLKNPDSLLAWMKRLTVNQCLMFLRTKKYNLIFQEFENKENQDFSDQTEEETEVLEEKIVELLHGMPIGYRTVFNLYCIENMSHADIAKELNITEGTSKSQYARAKQWMQKMLNKEYFKAV